MLITSMVLNNQLLENKVKGFEKKIESQKQYRERFKHIVVDVEIYERLKDLGRGGDSFNDTLRKILGDNYKID